MQVKKTEVSRVIETPGGPSVTRKTEVNFRSAENVQEMLELSGGDLKNVLSIFNSGRWSEIRTKCSNALAGKSPQQKAVEKMISAMKVMMPDLTDEQVKATVLSLPGMSAAASTSVEVLPAEIDDTYFDKAEVPAT